MFQTLVRPLAAARVPATPAPAPAAAPGTLFVLVNPASGAHEAAATRERVAAVFGAAGRPCELVPVAGPKALQQASEQAARRAAASGGVLVAVGGDGTLATVAQAAWQAGCAFGAIPQGTFNYFGRSHGIAQDAQQAAQALLRAQPTPVQVGLMNGKLFLVNASLGLYPQLLQDREAFKKRFGRHRWVAALSGLLTLLRWRHQLDLEIETAGGTRRLRTPTLFIGNNPLQLRQLGLPDAVADAVGAGSLAAVVVRPIGTWAMLGLLLRGAFGRLGEAEQVNSVALRSLTVRTRRMRRTKVAADGEVGVMTPPIRFEVAPRPLVLMLPRPQDRAGIE